MDSPNNGYDTDSQGDCEYMPFGDSFDQSMFVSAAEAAAFENGYDDEIAHAPSRETSLSDISSGDNSSDHSSDHECDDCDFDDEDPAFSAPDGLFVYDCGCAGYVTGGDFELETPCLYHQQYRSFKKRFPDVEPTFVVSFEIVKPVCMPQCDWDDCPFTHGNTNGSVVKTPKWCVNGDMKTCKNPHCAFNHWKTREKFMDYRTKTILPDLLVDATGRVCNKKKITLDFAKILA